MEKFLTKDITFKIWQWLIIGFISQPIYEFCKGSVMGLFK